jgi:hypothetical protein
MPISLSDLTSQEAVQAALDEFARLGQSAFLAKYGFGKSREFVVLNPRTQAWADSKAIAAVALAYQYPGEAALTAQAFSGGEATVAPRLLALGFEVHRISDIVGQDWSPGEVELVVADYLAMLTAELSG